MDGGSNTLIFVYGILILFSAYFSAAETAFSSFNRIRLKNMANSGNKKALKTLELSENFDNVLSAILIGNNIVNIALASIATVIFTYYFNDKGVIISTVVTTVLVLTFGEITPKSLAKESPERFAMFFTPVIRGLVFGFIPLNFLFAYWKKILSKVLKTQNANTITQAELITLVDEVESEGGINRHEGEIIRSAIEFNDLNVEEILTPRVNVVAINENASISEIKSLFINHGYSRIPVYRETVDNINGVILEKDFYHMLHNEKDDIQSIIKNIVCVAPHMKISELLRTLQHSKSHIAVVVDEYGGTMGIVTMEDILEELVGEIWDEHDEIIEHFSKISEGKYLIYCNADLEDLFEQFELKSKSEDYDAVTVSGWVVQECGRIPKKGDSFIYENLKVVVTKTDSKRVLEITVEVMNEDERADSD
ncbi:CBS domain containing-hemolysin-like protein [Natranaerovirga pectinivora]|uniref:CBS domain containing-hemolysin-like protein n=1 Tax=Natranaerovirga pectinivora TaxID=682400 RepID=A0A4R3MP29_9FIRM|nr:hemolysin family protein [Natranaerovirga pectinivora]TCT16320.1 CBS domain containing-hemolysin-like protein [Natranaerovirga pectinivora]